MWRIELEDILMTALGDDVDVKVLCMKYADDFTRNNKFRWTGKNDSRECQKEDILLKITEPTADGSNKRLQYYKLTEEDYCDASDILHLVLG